MLYPINPYWTASMDGFWKWIRLIASTGKLMIMPASMASEAEIEEAVVVARECGCKDLVLLHCISSYPAPIHQENLRRKFAPKGQVACFSLGVSPIPLILELRYHSLAFGTEPDGTGACRTEGI